jgi:hypothetical protein
MEKLQTIIHKSDQYDSLYLKVKEQHEWLLQIAHILGVENQIDQTPRETPKITSEGKSQELFGFLGELATKKGISPEHQEFISYVVKWTTNLKEGLFKCYDYPILPRTNNDMERYLRKLKGQHRKITGRQSWNNYILRYGPYIAFHDNTDSEEKILKRFKKADYNKFSIIVDAWEKVKEVTRKRFRYRKSPIDYLKKLEEKWYRI